MIVHPHAKPLLYARLHLAGDASATLMIAPVVDCTRGNDVGSEYGQLERKRHLFLSEKSTLSYRIIAQGCTYSSSKRGARCQHMCG